jgi:hypothetical protein
MHITDATKAAQDILDYIETHPHQHQQANWVNVITNVSSTLMESLNNMVIDDDPNVCNTTMCVAGTSVLLKEGSQALISHTSKDDFDVVAGGYLGLNDIESEMLFYCWDNAYALDMLRAVAAGDENKFYDTRANYTYSRNTEWSTEVSND